MNVKRIVLFTGLAGLLAVCGAFYWRGGREERILFQRWSAGPSVEQAAVGGNSPAPSISDKARHLADALQPPVIRRWTPEELESFLRNWCGKIKAVEERLIAAGEQPFQKTAAYEAALNTMTREDLLAVCYEIPSGKDVIITTMNWTSSDEEIRNLLFYQAFWAAMRRFPFDALQLPQNQLGSQSEMEVSFTLRRCAEVDREAAWEVVKQKFGGKNSSDMILRRMLEGAEKTDVAARLAQAKAWGVLDRVANCWPADASKTNEGQVAWIAALRETAPEDTDVRVRNFTKEVETSGGFDAVKRLIPQLAEKGTPLYDSILKEAAARDLEEEAAPKADWILSQVSPAAAGSTAETLMKQWTAADPLAASEWLDKVPRSAPWRQSAVLAFAKVIELHDPEAAALWRKAAGN